jgi:hypothetical protein
MRAHDDAGDQEADERGQPHLVEEERDGKRHCEENDQFPEYGDLAVVHGVIIA